MAKVGLVTDSTNCLPSDLIDKYDIRVIPVGMIVEGKLYRDLVDMSSADFWKLFPNLKVQPSTTAGNPADFVRAFTKIVESGKDVVCILVSKVLTATMESAFLARKLVKADYPDANIHLVDSRTSAGALGFIVLEAARAAALGKSTKEVLTVVEDVCSRVIYLSVVESLQYMIKTGRIPRNAGIGEAFGVKPIIGFVDDTGFTEVVSRVTGKDNALKKIADMAKKYVDTSLALHVIVHYSLDREAGVMLRDLMAAKYNCEELYLTEYSPVMVAATGPITGVSFFS